MIIDARGSALLKRHKQSLRIERVSVSFAKGKKALDDVSLIVPCGLCGILGRTGAGKTTLVGRPPLVLLDEPTVGLAPAERVAFLELVARVASTTVVLFTTSDPADIGDWCTQFVALHRGRLLLDGAPDRLRDAVRGYVWRASIPREQLAAMQSLHSVVGIESTGDVATVRVICAHPPGGGFAPVAPSLSDVYHLCVQHRAVSVAPRANHQRA